MLRILHFTDSTAASGAEWNLLTLLRNAPAGVENETAFLFDRGGLSAEFARVGPAHFVGNGRRSGYPRAVAEIAALLRTGRYDVLHTQLLAASFIGRAAAVGARVRVVTTLQSAFYDGDDFGRFTPVLREVMRATDAVTALRNDELVAVSAYVKDHFVDRIHFDPARVEVIFNCIEPDRVARPSDEAIAAARAAVGLAPGDRALLMVGRLVTQKAQDDAIRAMPAIARAVPAARLLLVGDGVYRGALERLTASLGVQGAVIFAGVRRDVPELLHGSDLFVFPSRREGLSVALAEAVSAGLPAVVCDIPQNREVVEGLTSVRMIPAQAPDRLAAAAIDLLTDPAARGAARAAAPGVAARFEPKAAAARFFGLCERLSAGRR
jgi:glycosyltransferase involved in cell wall biosynthesis